MNKKKIYIIGGPAKVGKSALTDEIKRGKVAGCFQWDHLQHPLIKNLFATKIPQDAATLACKGTITTQPNGIDEVRDFNKSFPLNVFVVPSAPPDALIEFPTDYVRTVIRMSFLGGNYGLGSIAFSGATTYLDSNNKTISTEPISIATRGEDENAWNALVPLIVEYDHSNQNNILIEGVAITPERVDVLKLENLEKKVVFIGYSDPELYVKRRIAYAKEVQNTKPNNYDWQDIQKKGEGQHTQDLLREAREQAPRNIALKERAARFAFQYFDLTERSFDEHVQIILDYFSGVNQNKQ